MIRRHTCAAFVAVAVLPAAAIGQSGKEMVTAHIESRRASYGQIAQQIWDWAEVGY